MKLAYLALASTGVLAVGAEPLSTDYTAKRTVTTNHSITIEWEVSDAGMTIDGEEPDFGGGRGGLDAEMSGESTRSVVSTDQVKAHADGQPTQVLRSFGDISVSGNMTMGDNEMEIDNKSPLSGVKLALALEDGEVTAKVEEGEEPPEAALAGHALTFGIDQLLPTEAVEDGAEYELGSSQIVAALGFDLEGTLFARPARGEGGERPERGEGGGGGRRGGRGMRGGGGGINMNQLAALDWDATATYVGEQEIDGRTVVVIELALEAEGTLPESQRGGRRRGGDRATGISTNRNLLLETEATVELKGQLTWDPKAKRPINLELEGEFTVDMQNSRDTERGLFESWRTTEGEIKININYTEEAL
tara:strand:+ start:60 stop:1145 length:1086 start_codon:yes stop_codon:yes gene_type:complete